MPSKHLRELYEQRRDELAPLFGPIKSREERLAEFKRKQSGTSTSVSSSASPIAPQPARTPPQHVAASASITPLSRGAVNALNPLRKLHHAYHALQQYYISPSRELMYGMRHAVPLDSEGLQQMERGEVQYNAALTFTLLTSLLHNASMLFFGSPGSGKTTLAEYVSSALFDLPLRTIQQATLYGHPELTEEKMIAMYDVVKMMNGERKLIVRDFARLPIRIIDEVNRIPPSKLSILYQLVDRGWTTYQNEMIVAPPAPLFATANGADAGNYDIPKPFLDRFDVAVVVQDLNPYHYGEFAQRKTRKLAGTLEQRVQLSQPLTAQDLADLRTLIQGISFPSVLLARLAHFAAEINACDMAGSTPDKKMKSNALYKKPGPLCESCEHYNEDNNICATTENGLSARSIGSVYTYAKGLAMWRGAREVQEDDLRYALCYGTWFKFTPTRKAFSDDVHYANDRLGWVSNLYDTSMHTFDELSQRMPTYKDLTLLVMQQSLYEQGKSAPLSLRKTELEGMMKDAANVDSLAKYPLIVALDKIYRSIR